jgi:hypothetical protein
MLSLSLRHDVITTDDNRRFHTSLIIRNAGFARPAIFYYIIIQQQPGSSGITHGGEFYLARRRSPASHGSVLRSRAFGFLLCDDSDSRCDA